MKKYAVILFVFSSLGLKAQSEVNYQGVIEQFQKLYNARNAEAHLHLSLQNVIDTSIATGGKFYFDKILVNGEVKKGYLPERNDKIQNIKL